MFARLRAPLALAFIAAALSATTAGSNTSLPVKNATGGTVNEDAIALPNGNVAPTHVLVDGGGTPYSPSNPLLTAPAIYPVAFTDRSGTVVTVGATVVDIAASTARKGGSIRAATTNTGLITITLKDAS
ncbi:hypothetical protein, partial [Beijerinckia sp. L45]|uniref:hypothetical protein n=1 Tax=Beijerinckia sp. L45 TaxID=1641855 RepID=UPI001AED70D3